MFRDAVCVRGVPGSPATGTADSSSGAEFSELSAVVRRVGVVGADTDYLRVALDELR